MIVAVFLTIALLLLAALHISWAIGFWIPIRDEATLARTVVGAKGVSRMPGAIACAMVAVALAFAASLPWTPAFPFQPLFMVGAAVVFLLRGMAAYLPSWRKLTPEQPFARLDRQVYGPLCLAIGAGYLFLVFPGGSE
jgi:hypothetical protein